MLPGHGVVCEAVGDPGGTSAKYPPAFVGSGGGVLTSSPPPPPPPPPCGADVAEDAARRGDFARDPRRNMDEKRGVLDFGEPAFCELSEKAELLLLIETAGR